MTARPSVRDAELGGDDRGGHRMIAGDHDRADAGAFRARDGLLRLVARRIDHADQPSEDEVLLDALVELLVLERVRRQRAEGDARACAAPRRPVPRSSAESPRGARAVSGLVSSPTSSCEQRASSTSGAPLVKTSRRSCRSASRVNRAHQLALGRERHFADAREARVERFILQPGLARRDDQRAFGRIALHRPAPVALLQHGVVGAVGDGERALQLDPQRARRSARRRPARTSPSGA